MSKLKTILFATLLLPTMLSAKVYYVATDGSDDNEGSKSKPFASIAMAQSLVEAGDTIYIRGGEYKMTTSDVMGKTMNLYHSVFILDKSGESDTKRICYFGYPGERPVFDISGVNPEDGRISVFYVTGSYLHLRNFEIVGTPMVYVSGNSQSECISNRGGSNNVYENLAMHDGMAIGFYLVSGANNLVLNCDAYNNFDSVSDGGTGGNTDGFGGHPSVGGTGNVFRGCRAWWNSDDGFDLIHSGEGVTIENCWAFYNGYKPGTFKSAADGNGIKAGGYGMNENSKIPDSIPTHIVKNCIAYRNKAGGFYANHHLGGLEFYNNTSYYNRNNYNMVCRKSKEEPVDVDGYGHTLENNVSFEPREAHLANIDQSACTLSNNSFAPTEITLTESDFESIDPEELMAARQSDGSLPEIGFLVPTSQSQLTANKMGYTFEVPAKEEDDGLIHDDEWLMEAAICIDGTTATIKGPNAEYFTKFYVNDTSVKIKNQTVDLSEYTGELKLKATSTKGGIIMLNVEF